MSNQKEIAVLRSKLTVYRNGLDRAKEKGDIPKICEWLESIRHVRRELEELL